MSFRTVSICLFAIATACGGSDSTNNNNNNNTSGADPCKAIVQADVQALLTNQITSLDDEGGGGVCIYRFTSSTNGDSSLTVTLFPSDADKEFYMTLSGSDDQQLTGFGDEAYWNEPVRNQTAPEVSVHKGNASCVLQPPDYPDITLNVTVTVPSVPEYTVTDADAEAYSRLMAKVCTEALSVY